MIYVSVFPAPHAHTHSVCSKMHARRRRFLTISIHRLYNNLCFPFYSRASYTHDDDHNVRDVFVIPSSCCHYYYLVYVLGREVVNFLFLFSVRIVRRAPCRRLTLLKFRRATRATTLNLTHHSCDCASIQF